MRLINHLLRSILLTAALLVSPFISRGAATAGNPDSSRVVVMISVDGLAGYYLDDPKAEMPVIRQLAGEGMRAASMRAAAPTVTWPNHTTLVTGDYPAQHGVVGNNYYDRATGKQVTLIWDPIYDKDQIVKVPTIYDLAKESGLKTTAVRWPASRGAKTLDWTTPDVVVGALYKKYTTPELQEEWSAAKIGVDGSRNGGEAPEHIDISGSEDEEVTRGFDLILQKHKPNLGLLHLLNVDHTEHSKGPRSPEAYAAIKEADRQVGEVWNELKKDYPGKATLIIVSDHGFSPIEHVMMPNVILRNAGLLDVKGPRVVGGAVRIVPQGGSALVYILDQANRASIVERVKKALDGVKGVDKVVGPDDLLASGFGDAAHEPNNPDMLLMAKEGWVFGDTAAGALPFVDKPERNGSHGHNPDIPDLHATFVAWGVGIKAGSELGEIRNIDVAPTIAKLLGVEMGDVAGKPLPIIETSALP
jgi:predicted AlkP superfamily pyrophosphatase or phosphodiesterase